MTTAVKIANHLTALERKHRELDETIQVLYAERVNDDIINNHKVQKLKLKEEIEKVKQDLKDKENGA